MGTSCLKMNGIIFLTHANENNNMQYVIKDRIGLKDFIEFYDEEKIMKEKIEFDFL